MSTRIQQKKCPRNVTQKMSTKSHPKRGHFVDIFVHEMSPKVSTRCHPFCPRNVTYFVHEMSATQELRHIYEKAGTQKQKLSFKNGLTPLCLSAIYVYLLLSSMMVCAIRDDFYLLYRLFVAFFCL